MTPEIEQVTAKLEDMRTQVAELDKKIQDCLLKSKEYRVLRQQAELDRAALSLRGIEPLDAQLRTLVAAETIRLREEAKKAQAAEDAKAAEDQLVVDAQGKYDAHGQGINHGKKG